MSLEAPQFDETRKAFEIERERERFLAARVGFVMVKTAPWSRLGPRFGVVNIHDIHDGVFSVSQNSEPDVAYPDLDALLEDWIGD